MGNQHLHLNVVKEKVIVSMKEFELTWEVSKLQTIVKESLKKVL